MRCRSVVTLAIACLVVGCNPMLAPTADVPATTESGPQFTLVDWRVLPATDVSKAKLVGEVRNDGTVAMGPQLQVTVRDPGKRVSGVDDFWPASVSDLDPGQTFAFSHFLDSGPEDTVELKVIGGRAWKH